MAYPKGKPQSEESKLKRRNALLGKKRNPEIGKKISLAKKGIKTGIIPVNAFKKGHSGWNKGKHYQMNLTDEQRQLRADQIKRFGKKIWTDEDREEARKRTLGEKSPKWKGGITKQSGYKSMMAQVRRKLVLQNGGTFSVSEWQHLKKVHENKCLGCKLVEPGIRLTVDHILPLSKGGRNDISNIQPLCLTCNLRKGAKLISYIP